MFVILSTITTLAILIFEIKGISQEETLVRTPGCTIPNFKMKFSNARSNFSCGDRFISVSKIGRDKIQFKMRKHYESCCYRYVKRSLISKREDKYVSFSSCLRFENRTIAVLSDDFINVQCTENDTIVYNDYYAIINPIDGKVDKNGTSNHKPEDKMKTDKRKTAYNVLLLGLDTMSRNRAYDSLKKTINFFNSNHWLDFRGYNKIAESTIPNVMAVLTGMKINFSNIKICSDDMFTCNPLLIWHQFQEQGYITAYGEDTIISDNFHENVSNGFSMPPTNHYMRPFFVAGEIKNGSSPCVGRKNSGIQILNYILDYTKIYKNEKFFGFFWVKSFSHDLDQFPESFDSPLELFFRELKHLGILSNTFVVFFSDHGIRYGNLRFSEESYHDERLPMFFMNVPDDFKQSQKFANLVSNQHRLISPYDLHLTLWDILRFSKDNMLVPKAEGCHRCMSLFRDIPDQRNCSHAGISDQWCSCLYMNVSSVKEFAAMYSLIKAVNYLASLSSTIDTKPCTKCQEFSLKTVLRINSLIYKNATKYYVAALTMSPDDVTYEVTIEKNIDRAENKYIYNVVAVQLISKYNGKGSCAIRKNQEFTCICQNIEPCEVQSP